MTVRRIIICDWCGPDPDCPMPPELDPSCYFDGPRTAAMESGWAWYRDGSGSEQHACPRCKAEARRYAEENR